MNSATCGVCGHDAFSAAPSRVDVWIHGGLTFMVRGTSVLTKVTGCLAEDALAEDLAKDIAPLTRGFRGTPHCATASWLLGRVAALAGATELLAKTQEHTELPDPGHYVLDLQVGRGRRLLGGVCVVGGVDQLNVIVESAQEDVSCDRIYEVFVASLRTAPLVLAKIRVDVKNKAFAPDCDVYRVVPDRNSFGWDGISLLGADNPIFGSRDARPVADLVTRDVALRIFQRRGPGNYHLERGWPERRNVEPLVDALLDAPEAHPIGQLALRSGDPAHGFAGVFRMIADRAPALTELEIGDEGIIVGPGGDRIHAIDLSELARAARRLRKLRLLHVGRLSFSGAELSDLVELEIHQRLRVPEVGFLHELGEADLPSIEAITIELERGQDAVAVGLDTMAPLLEARRVPKLRSLHLHTCRFEDSFFEALVTSPLIHRLKTLSLGWTRMTDRGAEAIFKHVRDISSLEHLYVDAQMLSEPIMSQLRALEPRVTVSLPEGKVPEKGDAQPRYVRHKMFGRGRVVEVSEGRLVIDFDKGGRKTLLAKFVEDEAVSTK